MGIEQREGVREGAEKGRRGWNVNILETAANSALLSSPPQAKEARQPRPAPFLMGRQEVLPLAQLRLRASRGLGIRELSKVNLLYQLLNLLHAKKNFFFKSLKIIIPHYILSWES